MALRRLLEDHVSRLSAEIEEFVARSSDRGRRELADQLNLAVRRLRLSDGREELAATLVDAAGAFSGGAALFRMEGKIAHGQRIRGVPEEDADRFLSLEAPLANAAAMAGAVATRDPVTAVTSESEVSAPLMEFFKHSAEGRVAIYPVVVQEEVPALLYTWGDVNGAIVELLVQVATAVWIALAAAAKPQPDLVQIAAPPAPPPACDALPAEEQPAHFRAQRFARVHVAEMRLHQAEAVLSGRAKSNLYEALRGPIDRSRENFHQTFYKHCPSMVDYFHLELVRTLANDDAELLGKDYPGPLA